MTLVELIAVSKVYVMGEVSVTALEGVDLRIDRGDFLALTGPSGSGKTTLLNLIGCLDLPTEGEVRIEGTATSRMRERELDQLRSRTFGMIFQSFNLIPVLTARENVALPLHLQPLSRGEREARVQEALNRVGLENFAGFLPDRLSGGQRQRVAVARALVTRPRLILADEPTASLDSANAFALVGLMRELNREHGVTFVFSTHDDRLLGQVRGVVEMRDGRIVARHAAPRGPSVANAPGADRVDAV